MSRRKFSSQFKSRVVLEALRGVDTIAQIATRHTLHPSQIQSWKAQALDGLSGIFSQNGSSSDGGLQEEQLSILERKVGQLTIENDFLKKNWSRVQKKSGVK